MILLTIDRIDILNACDKLKTLFLSINCADELDNALQKRVITTIETIADMVKGAEIDIGFDFIYKLEALTKTLDVVSKSFFFNMVLTPNPEEDKHDVFRINLFLINQVIDKLKRIHVDQYSTCIKLDDILYELKEIKKRLK